MADQYKVAVAIGLTNNVSPVLGLIMADLAGLGRKIGDIEAGFAGWAKSLGPVAAVLGGTAIVGGMVALAKYGGEVNHELELMKLSGMSNVEIQKALGQATITTGNVLTTTLVENLKHQRELRYAFGETSTAMEHLDEISKANAILNAVKGGGKDQVWELVKSLEQKGETYDPAAFSSYVNTMTKVIEATGGKVTPEMFMSTFKYGRTATLGWDESFIGGALPRLMQSWSGGGGSGAGGPGNALMSAFAKVVQGQMPKTAAEEFERLDLAPGGVKHITGSSESQITGGIKGRDLFMKNPYEWVQQILMPALAAKGITSNEAITAAVSNLFPVRTAAAAVIEQALQGRFHEGAKSPFEKDIALQKGAMGMPGYDELIKNDYPTLLKAFNQQWESLLQTIGSPMMQPGGPVLTAMASLTGLFNSMSQFAAANPEAIKYIAVGLAALATALIGIPAGLLLGIPAGITAIGVAIGTLAYIEWGAIRGYLLAFNDAMTSFINWLGTIADKIKGLFSGGKGGSFGKDLDDANKTYTPMRFDPGTNQPKAIHTAFSFNVDGQVLAQTVIEKMEDITEHATSSPNYNSLSHFARADGGMAST